LPGFGVIIIYAIVKSSFIKEVQLLIVSFETTSDNLTSNQVGLPAELKHINKRRKRN
jgi:hypothetical protein